MAQPRLGRQLQLLIAPFVAIAILWEVLAEVSILNPQFFPPPSATLALAVELYVQEGFLSHVWASLRRVLLATLIGGSSGIAIGVLAGWSREIRALVNPHLGLLYPIPKIALLPVLFSLFGITEAARVLTMSLAVFLLVAINTMGGVQQIEETYVEAALDNGAGTLALFRDVILPGALPQIMTGLSLGLGIGFILLVVIEMIAAESGLGYVVWNSWQLFTIERLYVSLLTINVLGVLFVHGTEVLGTYLTPWEDR